MRGSKSLLALALTVAMLWVAPAALATGGHHNSGEPKVDLSLNQTDDPDPVTAGNTVRYVITVKNNTSTLAAAKLALGSAVSKGQITSISGTGWSCGTHSSGRYAGCTRPALAGGATAPTVEVRVLTATSTSASTLYHGAGVWCSNCDKNEHNNYEVETTSVGAAGTGTSSGYIPPGGGSITTCAPAGVNATDHTCVTATFPPGPGGTASIVEGGDLEICDDPQPVGGCSGNSADVIVPDGYVAGTPIQVEFKIDDSEAPEDPIVNAFMKKDGVESVMLDCVTPGTPAPCFDALGQSRNDNNDWLGSFYLFSQDPIFEVGDFVGPGTIG